MSRKKHSAILTVNRLELAQALRLLRPLVRKPPNEILKSALLSSPSRRDAPCLTISATNLETSLSLEIALQETPQEGVEALVDLERLEGFVSADWGEMIGLSLEKGRLLVSGEAVARFHVESMDFYPELPQPAGGEGWTIPMEVIEEIARVAALVADKDRREWSPWGLVHVFENSGRLNVLGGSEQKAWWYQGGPTADEDFPRFVLTKEAAALLSSLHGGLATTVSVGVRQDFFSGPGYLLSTTRPEGMAAPVDALSGERAQPTEWLEMPALGGVLPAIEAVAREAGARSPLLLTEEHEKTLVSCKSDFSEVEGWIAGKLPIYKTVYPDDLLAVLKELDRVAGTEKTIEVGRFGPGHLRFRVAGVAEAFVSGAQ